MKHELSMSTQSGSGTMSGVEVEVRDDMEENGEEGIA